MKNPALVALVTLLASAVYTPIYAQSPYYWNQDAAGTWDTTTLNWRLNNTGINVAFPGGNNTAVFGNVITANRAIAVGAGGVNAGGFTFENVGNFVYTLGTASNNITLNSGAATDFIRVNSGTVGNQLVQSSNISFANNLTLLNSGAFGVNTLSISSVIDRAASGGNVTFDGQSNTTTTGAIGANVTGGIIKNGNGTVILAAAANAYSGGITINAGVLGINSNDTMLGNPANGVTINAGGAFRFNNTVTTSAGRNFIIGGTDSNPSIIDLGSSVTASHAGTLTGSGTAQISLTGGTTAGTLAIQNNNASFTGKLVIGAPGVLVGSVVSQKLFTSANGPTLRIDATGTGLNGGLTASTGITLNNASVLSILQPSTGTLNTGRLAGVPLTFNSARFVYTPGANGGVAIAENLGTISLSGMNAFSGGSTLAGTATAGSTSGNAINFGTLTRVDNSATAYFRASTSGNGQVGGTAGAATLNIFMGGVADPLGSSTSRGIIPWASFGNGLTGTFMGGPMTYDAGGFRPLISSEAVSGTSIAAVGATNNAFITGSAADVGTVNSLWMASGGTLSGSGTINITNGYWGFNGSITLNGPVVDFGSSNRGYIFASDTMTVSGATSFITGTKGFVISGFSTSFNTVNLTHATSSTLTGGITLNGSGRLTFTLDGQLGASSSGITFQGGQLQYANTTVDATLNAARTITVGASNGSISANTAGRTLAIPGNITGPGLLEIGGTGANATAVINLTNPVSNTYTGGTLLTAGILQISDVNQLGTGELKLNAGTLQAAGTLTFANPPVLFASSTINTNSNIINLNGGIKGSGGTLGIAAITNTLTKAGAGTLNINGPVTMAGPLTMSNVATGTSTVTISGNGAAPELGTVTVGANGVFNVSDVGTANPNRLGRTTNLTLNNGGTVGAADPIATFTTNSAGSTFNLGTLTVTGGTGAEPNAATVNITDGNTGNNTFTFLSFPALAANNTLSILGTANLGQSLAGGTHIFFQTPPTLSGGIIPGVTFTGSGGTGTATYSSTFGLQLFVTITGTFIDNFNNVGAGSPTSTIANYTTSGITTANLGATVNTLTMAHDVNLVTGLYNATTSGGTNGLGNENAPNNVLIIKNGLTANTTASAVNSTNPAEIRFGSAVPTANAVFTTNVDLTIGTNVTLSTNGGLTKTGAGALNINGINSITGLYSVAAGTLALNSNATASGITGAGGTVSIAASRTFTLNGTDGSTQTYLGVLAGSGALTTTVGFTGVQVISGNSATYTGAVTINGGTITPGNAGALGPATNPTITVNSGGTLALQGGITLNAIPVSLIGNGAAGRSGAIDNISGNNIYNGAITIAGATTIGSTSGTLTLGGGITSTTNPVTFNAATAGIIDLNLAGAIVMNLGTQPLTKIGGGVLVLPNLANTFGTININGGLVQASADNNFGATTNVINMDSGGIQYGAVFALNPARSVVISANGGILDTQANNISYAVPTSGASSTSVLNKRGTGTLTLDVTLANAGGLTVQQGVVNLGVSSTLNSTAQLTVGNIIKDNSASFNLNSRDATVSSLTFIAKETGGASSQLIGPGTITVNGIVSFIDNSTTPGNSFPVNIASSVTALNLGGATRNFNVAGNSNGTADFVISTPITNGGVNYTGTPSVFGGAAAGLTFGAANNYTGPTIINRGVLSATVANAIPPTTALTLAATTGNTAQLSMNAIPQTVSSLSSTSAGTNLIVTSGAAAILTVNQSTNTTFNGVISGPGLLRKSGVGTLTLTGTNTYTGATTVNGGVLNVGAGGVGSLAATAVTVNIGAGLGGSGTINGAVIFAAGSAVTPGNSVGTLTVANNVTINGNAAPNSTNWNIETNGIASNTLATADQVNVDRLVITGAANNLTFVTSTTNLVNINLTLSAGSYTNFQPVFYRIASANAGSNFVGFDATHFNITSTNFLIAANPTIQIDSNHLVVSFVPVPEPATVLALSTLGMGAIGLIRRRLRKTNADAPTIAV